MDRAPTALHVVILAASSQHWSPKTQPRPRAGESLVQPNPKEANGCLFVKDFSPSLAPSGDKSMRRCLGRIVIDGDLADEVEVCVEVSLSVATLE